MYDLLKETLLRSFLRKENQSALFVRHRNVKAGVIFSFFSFILALNAL